MGEEKTESPELGMSMIARFACEHPELLSGIERYGEYEWRFRIGVGGPGFWLRFNDYSKSYTVNYCNVSQGAGEVLAKNLRDGYLKALNAELAKRVPEFAKFREKVLGHFEVKPEREAGANVEMGGANCLTAYTVSFYNGAYRIRRQATGEEILAATSYKEALKIARLMNAEHYGFQRQQEGDAR